MAETTITKIEPLSGNNYKSWKYNAKLLLMDRGLWGIADGTEKAPVIKQEDEAKADSIKLQKDWKLRSDKAYSIIALSVEKSLQAHITATTDASEAWSILKNHFEVVSVSQIVRLNRRFYAANMEENGDLLKFVTDMTALSQELREMNEDISTKKFAMPILGSLPQSYDNFITSLNTRSADELTWESIRGSLMEEYMKRKEKSNTRTGISDHNSFKTEEEALFTSSNSGNAQRGRGGSFRGAPHMYESDDALYTSSGNFS